MNKFLISFINCLRSIFNRNKTLKISNGKDLEKPSTVSIPCPVELAPKPASLEVFSPPIVSEDQLKKILPNLPFEKCKEYLPFLLQAMNEFEINTPVRVAAFIAQTAHETAEYKIMIENLNYSANGLRATWPRRFPVKEKAELYARQPQKIANCVYANRLGNSDEGSGEGWKYRGRGIIQITGKYNYGICQAGLNLDLITLPELLEQPLHAFRSGAWFWSNRQLNNLADEDNFIGITRAINGGLNGLDDRKKYYTRAKNQLGIV